MENKKVKMSEKIKRRKRVKLVFVFYIFLTVIRENKRKKVFYLIM